MLPPHSLSFAYKRRSFLVLWVQVRSLPFYLPSMFSVLPFSCLVLPLSTFSFRIEGMRSAVSSSPHQGSGPSKSPDRKCCYVYRLKGPLLSCDNSFLQRRLTRLIYSLKFTGRWWRLLHTNSLPVVNFFSYYTPLIRQTTSTLIWMTSLAQYHRRVTNYPLFKLM